MIGSQVITINFATQIKKQSMKFSKILFLGLLSLGALFIGCSKSSDPVPTKEQLLTTAKGWIRSDYTVTESDGNVREQFSDLKACEKDDVWFFTSDGKIKATEGATSCSPPRAEANITWSFNADKTKLTVGSEIWDLTDLSSITLKITLANASTDPQTKANVTVLTFTAVK